MSDTQTVHLENILLTKITEVNLSAFVYKLFHEDIFPIIGINVVLVERNLHEIFCKEMQIN